MLSLMEPEVAIRVRSKDVDLANEAVERAQKSYEEISGRTVTISVEDGLSNDVYVPRSLHEPRPPTSFIDTVSTLR